MLHWLELSSKKFEDNLPTDCDVGDKLTINDIGCASDICDVVIDVLLFGIIDIFKGDFWGTVVQGAERGSMGKTHAPFEQSINKDDADADDLTSNSSADESESIESVCEI